MFCCMSFKNCYANVTEKLDLLHVHASNLLRYAVLPEVYERNVLSNRQIVGIKLF